MHLVVHRGLMLKGGVMILYLEVFSALQHANHNNTYLFNNENDQWRLMPQASDIMSE